MLIMCLIELIILVVTVAALILLESKLLAMSQRSVGPAILGSRGILQMIADVMKPLFKDIFEHKLQTVTLVSISICFFLVTQFVFAALFEFKGGAALYKNLEAVVYLQSMFSCGSCMTMLVLGYLSGTKYGMLGAMSLSLSEFSNDTCMTLLNAVVLYTTAGFDYDSMLSGQSNFWNLSALFIMYATALMFHVFIAAQRSPTDLMEVEGELVAGYNMEYSGADVLVMYFAEYFHLFNAALQFMMSLFGLAFIY